MIKECKTIWYEKELQVINQTHGRERISNNVAHCTTRNEREPSPLWLCYSTSFTWNRKSHGALETSGNYSLSLFSLSPWRARTQVRIGNATRTQEVQIAEKARSRLRKVQLPSINHSLLDVLIWNIDKTRTVIYTESNISEGTREMKRGKKNSRSLDIEKNY